MIKSILSYPGGKYFSAKYLISLFPPNFQEYREPFLGGGSIYVRILQIYKDSISYHINDIYSNLINFWITLRDNPNAIAQNYNNLYLQYQNGVELYQQAKILLNSTDNTQKALAFFILNKLSFSGLTESGGFSNHRYQREFKKFNPNKLIQFSTFMQKTIITNQDYSNLIHKQGNNVFIFLDPPYYSTIKHKLYGKRGNTHVNFDFQRLADNLKNIPHKYLMTIDNSDYTRKLFDFTYIYNFQPTYYITGNQKIGEELIVSNYPINSLTPLN